MKYRRPLGFPLCRSGSPLTPDREPVLAPGVRGYAIRSHGAVYIPLIMAEAEGAGDVGRFLDKLRLSWAVIRIPNVTSTRLRGMLERRGFELRYEKTPHGDEIDVYESRPS